jgi:endonuclease-3
MIIVIGAVAHYYAPGMTMSPDRRTEMFERLRAANPNPRTELNYGSPFELLVSVVLSAQATDKSVNRATAGLFRVANTPEALVRLGRRGLERHIKSIGPTAPRRRTSLPRASC